MQYILVVRFMLKVMKILFKLLEWKCWKWNLDLWGMEENQLISNCLSGLDTEILPL